VARPSHWNYFLRTTPSRGSLTWTDPSPRKVRHVVVAPVVHWRYSSGDGTGPALVFLTGLGDAAHVFDDFAPRLRDKFRVYGITRRGFGTSSAPVVGYDAAMRARDIIKVFDALGIDRVVSVGHSIAGDELSKVGAPTQHGAASREMSLADSTPTLPAT
jgi:pimeloyl-ACP methyl ester carboxylesterase